MCEDKAIPIQVMGSAQTAPEDAYYNEQWLYGLFRIAQREKAGE